MREDRRTVLPTFLSISISHTRSLFHCRTLCSCPPTPPPPPPKLASWVRCIREKRAILVRKGLEYEEIPPGRSVPLPKTLTPGRIGRLDSIGFAWTVSGPNTSWEDRFRDLMDYHESNDGAWPSQSMGALGEWVHKQRTKCASNDPNYMKTKVPRVRLRARECGVCDHVPYFLFCLGHRGCVMLRNV
jgi:hypothetical protein